MMKNDEGRKVVLKIQEDIGIAKGKIEGKLEKAKSYIKKLLNKKFKNLPKKIEDKIDLCTDISMLDYIADNIFDIDNVEDIII
ncbi:MAG: DUF4351 domain-containing protein [Candidatus Sericytochromatia bacterium]|nr:DUF4351 domain-containing protein [Candidatus Sericytochromatia bacterium]